jgi:hypothetical protein
MKTDDELLTKAAMQFIGFLHGRQSVSSSFGIAEMVQSMGLTHKELEELISSGEMPTGFSDDEIEIMREAIKA